MLPIKKKNPLVMLMGLLVVMFMIFMVLQQTMMVAPSPSLEETLPERGNVWNDEVDLAPFMDKTNKKDLLSLKQGLRGVGDSFLLKKREDLFKYLSLDLDWNDLKKLPYRYIGSLMPTKVKGKGVSLEGELEGVVEFQLDGEPLWVYFQQIPDLGEDSSYMDLIFLGSATHQGKSGWIGVAKESFELPGSGLYEKMESDSIALNEIVDDMENKSLQAEVRRVSFLALEHYFAKVQGKEFVGKELLKAGYMNLMQQPERFRGGLVSFTGSLIHVERKMFPKGEVPVGMEFYYQGYLLNSDRILYLFRSLEKPDVELQKVLTVEGYFLQRYNFLNRQNRATWVPLLIATKLIPESEKGLVLSGTERNGVITIGLVVFLVLLWGLFRTNKIQKKLKVKKPFKKPSELKKP